jgi:hypothetical protein
MGVLVVQVVVTLLLTGFIWTIQVLHYPLFELVGDDTFVAYEAAHSARVTWLIVVPWAVQGLTTAWVLLAPPAGVPRWLALAAGVAAALTVLITVTLSVPAHVELADGFAAEAHRRLVTTNWLRTAAWTAHAAMSVWMLLRHLRAG